MYLLRLPQTPKLLKIPVHPCARTVAVFIFPLYSPQYKSIKAIAGYGIMGSKPPALWQSEPANRNRFARRIPSIGCVMTHPHLLTIFPLGKMTANELARGYSPCPPLMQNLHQLSSLKQKQFCQTHKRRIRQF